MLRPVTASSAPARVALLIWLPVAAGIALGQASIRIGELPGHWYIDVRT